MAKYRTEASNLKYCIIGPSSILDLQKGKVCSKLITNKWPEMNAMILLLECVMLYTEFDYLDKLAAIVIGHR